MKGRDLCAAVLSVSFCSVFTVTSLMPCFLLRTLLGKPLYCRVRPYFVFWRKFSKWIKVVVNAVILTHRWRRRQFLCHRPGRDGRECLILNNSVKNMTFFWLFETPFSHHAPPPPGVCEQRMGDQHWRRRQLRRVGPDLRHPEGGHCQSQDQREAVGHRQRQLQENTDGEDGTASGNSVSPWWRSRLGFEWHLYIHAV